MPDDDDDEGPTDTDVDAVIQEFKGDLRGAIHALLHDLWILAADFTEAVSLGYVRGEMSAGAERVMAKRRADTE